MFLKKIVCFVFFTKVDVTLRHDLMSESSSLSLNLIRSKVPKLSMICCFSCFADRDLDLSTYDREKLAVPYSYPLESTHQI